MATAGVFSSGEGIAGAVARSVKVRRVNFMMEAGCV
jgi:hypothetical protein